MTRIIKKYKKIIIFIVLAIVVFLVVKIAYFEIFKLCGDCERSPSNNLLKLTKNYSNLLIIYTSENGSLPPPYHRERIFTISTDGAEKIKGNYTIRDYKNIIEEKSLSVSREQLNKLITALVKINSKSNDDTVSGCTGGTSNSIKVSQNNKTLIDTSAYNCAFKSSNESVKKFFSEAELIIPRSK